MSVIWTAAIWAAKMLGTIGLAIGKGSIAVAGAAGKLLVSATKFMIAHPELAKALGSGIAVAATYDEIKTMLAGKGVPTDQVEAYLSWIKQSETQYKTVDMKALKKEQNRLTKAGEDQVNQIFKGSNHKKWWAPKDWMTSVLYQNERIKPLQRYWGFLNVKHMSFTIPDIDWQRLSSIQDVVMAYFRRYEVFGDAQPSAQELERYQKAFKDLIHNSVVAYSLCSEVMRSQNARDLRLQGSSEYGKIMTPIHYVPDAVPSKDTFNDYAPSQWIGSHYEDVPVMDFEFNSEAGLKKPDDIYAKMKISNDEWSRAMKLLRENSFMHDNTREYIDYMIRGAHCDSEGDSTSEMILFYYAHTSLVKWDGDGTVVTSFAMGPATYIESGSDFAAFMNAFEEAQNSIINRFPVILPLVKYLGLAIADRYKKSSGKGVNSKTEARKSLNLFENSARDPSHTTLPLIQMDKSFTIASKNAFVIEPSTMVNAGEDVTGWTYIPCANISVPMTLGALGRIGANNDLSIPVNFIRDYCAAAYNVGMNPVDAWLSAVRDRVSTDMALLPAPNDAESYAQDATTTFKPTNSAIDTGTLFSYMKWGSSAPLFLNYITNFSSDGRVIMSKSFDRDAAPSYLIAITAGGAAERITTADFEAIDMFAGEYDQRKNLAYSLNAKSCFMMAPIAKDTTAITIDDTGFAGEEDVPGYFAIKLGLFDENDQIVKLPEDWDEQCHAIWMYNQTGLLDFSELADKANDIVNMYTFS